MAKPVLQTRNVGMQTHYSRHPLAPMEIVYECEEPPKRQMRTPLWARILIPLCLVYLAYAAVSVIVYILTSGSVTI